MGFEFAKPDGHTETERRELLLRDLRAVPGVEFMATPDDLVIMRDLVMHYVDEFLDQMITHAHRGHHQFTHPGASAVMLREMGRAVMSLSNDYVVTACERLATVAAAEVISKHPEDWPAVLSKIHGQS
jgi:hypothetical protein